MEEEFRKLTLQIIGEAFLSLPPEECDRVSSCTQELHNSDLYYIKRYLCSCIEV